MLNAVYYYYTSSHLLSFRTLNGFFNYQVSGFMGGAVPNKSYSVNVVHCGSFFKINVCIG